MSNLSYQLSQFTGTESYYKYVGGTMLTDGAKYLADEGQCYWLLDIIASLKLVPECEGEEFMSCTFTKNENGGGTFVADDGNENVLYTQEIEFTDFPEDEINLFFIDNIILLPSEY